MCYIKNYYKTHINASYFYESKELDFTDKKITDIKELETIKFNNLGKLNIFHKIIYIIFQLCKIFSNFQKIN